MGYFGEKKNGEDRLINDKCASSSSQNAHGPAMGTILHLAAVQRVIEVRALKTSCGSMHKMKMCPHQKENPVFFH